MKLCSSAASSFCNRALLRSSRPASRLALRVCPWRWASNRHSRSINGSGSPSSGAAMSRPRKVRMKSSRQSMLSSSALASRLSGKPPRSHSCCQRMAGATSLSRNGVSSTWAMRPARLSWLWCSSGPEAEPSSRNRPGRRSRSISARSRLKKSGSSWISSRHTRSWRWASKNSSGSCRRARSLRSCKSSNTASPRSANSWRASVDLPHCRGPSSRAAGARFRALLSASWACLGK